MKDPTPELVRSFYDFMTDRFRTKVVDKSNAVEMQIVSLALRRAGIVDRDEFLRKCATVVGRRLYLPFDLGGASNGFSPWDQITECTRLHQIITQYDEDGPLVFLGRYLWSHAERTRYEADALRSVMELQHWRYGQTSGASLVDKLRGYGLTDEDLQVAGTILRMSAETVRQGAVINYASRVAIDWLNTHAPDLRAEGPA